MRDDSGALGSTGRDAMERGSRVRGSQVRGSQVRLADDRRLKRLAWKAATVASQALARPTAGLRALPDYLIVGAQRAGTTSLHKYLLQSPSMIPARLTKGVHYFDANYDRDLDWYRAHFPLRARMVARARRIGSRVVTGEASPYYLFHPDIPRRIAEVLPETSAIVVLRDPAERAWSQYHHEFGRGYEHLDAGAAFEAEAARLAGEEERLLLDPQYQSHSHQHHSYVARGRYLEQLERLWAQLGEDRVHIVESGALKQDPQRVVDGVATFLGITPWQLTDPAQHNARAYRAPDADVHRWLQEQFAEDNERLFERLGRRYAWGSEQGATS
ncbi:sulfotransferase domain-containing protein [Euzebya tangerina]|uniref:sulfotransferase domain-containing protein n=1 Tax=Euzebya tangerina TaxID=591198 RepID=UPI000E314CDE|nr:sulfotransferase domain-containing protein [Euzebya tangerina]